MRVLEVLSGTTACGATVHTLQIAKELLRRGNALTLMVKPYGWTVEQAKRLGIPTLESRMKRFPFKDYIDAVRFCKQAGIEVILAHMTGANNFSVVVGRLARVPVVLRAHAHTVHPHWWLAQHIIAVSEQTRRYHITHNFVSPKRISTAHGFIDPERLAVPDKGVRQQVRAELGLTPENFVVGVIGNIIPRKGVLYLIRALPPVVAQHPSLRVALVGVTHPESYGVRVRNEIARLSLEPYVLWLGERRDVPNLLQAIDLYALPTLNDMLPLALLEAMWAGLPILSTTVGGIPEAVRDGIDGWLVPPKDSSALSTALLEILTNPDERARRGQNAHQRVLKSFTVEPQVAKIEAILQQVVADYTRRT